VKKKVLQIILMSIAKMKTITIIIITATTATTATTYWSITIATKLVT